MGLMWETDMIWADHIHEWMLEDYHECVSYPQNRYFDVDGENIFYDSGLSFDAHLAQLKWEQENPFAALAKEEAEKRDLFNLLTFSLRETLERAEKETKKISPTRMQVERSLVWTNR